MFAALLDTCVLWPSAQRDFLLSLAVEGMYRPLWSDAVLDELHRTESTKRRERHGDSASAAEAFATTLVARMRTSFEDALVTGWEVVAPQGLPDPDDEHVLAAAIVGGAGALVTENIRDFPDGLVPDRIRVLSARRFITDTVGVDPDRAARALEAMAQRRTTTVTDVMTTLEGRYGLHDAMAVIRSR
ncbi:MAG: PIN domain-containing protein [Kineosporiaceae bacterium]